jgi:hypothetical protein
MFLFPRFAPWAKFFHASGVLVLCAGPTSEGPAVDKLQTRATPARFVDEFAGI